MNIYIQEFKASLRSVLIWSASIATLLFVFMSIAPSFSANAALLNQMMANFPKEILVVFGMTNMDFSTILGYFGLIFLFSQICLAIQAANYGFSLVSIEETELTADFLLAKPVSRKKIMESKLLSALTGLTVTNLVVWVTSFITLRLFSSGEHYSVKPVIVLLLSILLFQLFFLSVGMVISLMVRRVRNVTPFSMGLVFGLYILNAFGGMIGEKSLEILSPFRHFDPNYILLHAALDPLVVISLIVSFLSLIGSFALYTRRNILSAV
ncbi:MAG: ABC transporter permease subunit [Chloroflexi bacterium]|nr:ABC transporter permease subunit [Chloroflexota bacterium]